jgi:hypothetical protein
VALANPKGGFLASSPAPVGSFPESFSNNPTGGFPASPTDTPASFLVSFTGKLGEQLPTYQLACGPLGIFPGSIKPQLYISHEMCILALEGQEKVVPGFFFRFYAALLYAIPLEFSLFVLLLVNIKSITNAWRIILYVERICFFIKSLKASGFVLFCCCCCCCCLLFKPYGLCINCSTWLLQRKKTKSKWVLAGFGQLVKS